MSAPRSLVAGTLCGLLVAAAPGSLLAQSQHQDHSKHQRGAKPTRDTPQADHATMDHSKMDHSKMDHAAMGHGAAAGADDAALREPIPALTDADRAAAFPDVAGHSVHDDGVHYSALFNRLETWDADEGTPLAWEGSAWVGTDLDRLWIRAEGERVEDETESSDIELLYGRSVGPWWDVVAGVKHDFAPGPSQTWAAFGVQGLSPYKFEVQATAYVGESGRTAVSVEAEYELLLTNRLILQPLIEVDAFGKDDERRGVASGLGTFEAGFRLRYEFNRCFAPYVGFVYERALGDTADLRRDEGEDVDEEHVVAGVRLWF